MNGSLFLTPADPRVEPPDRALVVSSLRAAGLIGKPLGKRSYLSGEDFLRHITFAGCSPYLLLEPPADGGRNFCHVTVHAPFARPQLQVTTNRSRPRCPHCRKPIPHWQDQLDNWKKYPETRWQCPECAKQTAALDLDWRQYAATGHLLVEIHNVFPGEAVPGDALLEQLRADTGSDWRYAWADSFRPPGAVIPATPTPR